MVRRATKSDARDLLRELHGSLLALKSAVTADNGVLVVGFLQDAETTVGDLREVLEDRYGEAFDEIEGEIVEDEVVDAEVVEEEEA